MEEQTATQRVFTISEVNALIPALSSLVQDQLREQSEIEHGLAELVTYLRRPEVVADTIATADEAIISLARNNLA